MRRKVYKELATKFNALQNCIKTDNKEWEEKHRESIGKIVYYLLPSGSGIDNGNKFDYDNSKKDKLIIYSSFHVMDENGFYEE
jgi:hypothetical protein